MENKTTTTTTADSLESALKAKRHYTREHATVEVYGKSGRVHCKMNNLSTTGAFFETINTGYTLKQGDIVRVTINLRQINKTHTLHGEVVWNKGLGLGVAFIKQKDVFKKLAK
jgi:hypothetical protein